jgi:dephospho-CoA kinase
VGLTGGIATGKTSVRRSLERAGLPTLDLDAVTHALLAAGGEAHAPVVEAFGPVILDEAGVIDRRKLGGRVFADAGARQRLEAIVHPLVRQQEGRWVEQMAADGHEVVVVDAALLVEAGLHARFDRLLVTHCPPDEQLRRLRERDGLSPVEASARVAAQLDPQEKLHFAHVVVDTSGSFEETDRAVAVAVLELGRSAAERGAPVIVNGQAAAGCLLGGPPSGPRGLDPLRLLSHVAATGGLEMQRVALLLDPPCAGPWLACARGGASAPPPETLAAPLALWCLRRVGEDHAFLSVAAYSLARLTHRDPAELASACLVAHAAMEALARGAAGPSLRERLPWWETEAAARAGAAAQPRARDAILLAAKGGGEAGTVAGALRGVDGPPAGRPVPPEVTAALLALAAPAA